MDCIFCKIAKKEVPKEFIYESEEVLSFADIRPSAPVHYLLIPKEHIDSIADLKDGHQTLVAKLIFAAKEVAEKLRLKGYKLVFNVGPEGGQVIPHIHLHLIGGWTKKEDIEHMPHPGLDK